MAVMTAQGIHSIIQLEMKNVSEFVKPNFGSCRIHSMDVVKARLIFF